MLTDFIENSRYGNSLAFNISAPAQVSFSQIPSGHYLRGREIGTPLSGQPSQSLKRTDWLRLHPLGANAVSGELDILIGQPESHSRLSVCGMWGMDMCLFTFSPVYELRRGKLRSEDAGIPFAAQGPRDLSFLCSAILFSLRCYFSVAASLKCMFEG